MPMSPARSLLRIVVSAAVCAVLLPVTPAKISAGENNAAIERLQKDLTYLASDDLEGRGVGTDGLGKAADYVAEEFKAAGLAVNVVDGTPFQKFTLPNGSKLTGTNRLSLRSPKGEVYELKPGDDFEVCSFGGSGRIEAELVFCGYGIDNNDLHYNDYADVDVKGKIVIIMRRNPHQGRKDSAFGDPHGGIGRDADLRTKVSRAFGKGAAGIVFVNDPYTGRSERAAAATQIAQAKDELYRAAREFVSSDDSGTLDELKENLKKAVQRIQTLEDVHADHEADPLMEFGYAGTGKPDDLPIAHLSLDKVNTVLQGALGKDLAALEGEIDSDLKPRSANLGGWKAELQTSIELVETEIANVIGVLEGSGPLADETIVVGAHVDHVGYGGQNSLAPGTKAVHNGADDNGSGTVALIELARRLSSRDKPPARRIVFIAFTAEELGLIGSARYVKEPVFPLEKTIAMFNMDMVGRLTEDQLTVFGTGTSSRWKPLVVELGEKHNFRLSLQPEGFGPSDHSSFYGKKIPVLHFFTGTHADYHRPTDDVDKINFAGIDRVVAMLNEIVDATDSRTERPDYVEIKQRANIARSGSRPYFGSIPDFASEGAGYGISGVSPGSPADKGGLKGGDRIVQIGEIKISDLDDFDLALRRFSAGDEVTVKVLREGKEVEAKVTLTHPK